MEKHEIDKLITKDYKLIFHIAKTIYVKKKVVNIELRDFFQDAIIIAYQVLSKYDPNNKYNANWKTYFSRSLYHEVGRIIKKKFNHDNAINLTHFDDLPEDVFMVYDQYELE